MARSPPIGGWTKGGKNQETILVSSFTSNVYHFGKEAFLMNLNAEHEKIMLLGSSD